MGSSVLGLEISSKLEKLKEKIFKYILQNRLMHPQKDKVMKTSSLIQ